MGVTVPSHRLTLEPRQRGPNGAALCYPLPKKVKQMLQISPHFASIRPRFPRVAAQVLPSATRPRLFAGD